MDKKTLNKFRHILVEHRDTLDTWIKSNSESQEVHLGGAPVQEVKKVVSQHNEALERIDSGEFGKERLASYVKAHFHQSADVFLAGLRKTVKGFAGGFHDDVTLLVIKSR